MINSTNPGTRYQTLQRRSRVSLAAQPGLRGLNPDYSPYGGLLFQEHIIRRIWRRERGAGLVAGAVDLAALGIDALDCGDARERAGAACLHGFELQPGNVILGCSVGTRDRLADDPAAIRMLPGRAHIVAADGFAILDQSGNRLAELPGEFAAFTSLAV